MNSTKEILSFWIIQDSKLYRTGREIKEIVEHTISNKSFGDKQAAEFKKVFIDGIYPINDYAKYRVVWSVSRQKYIPLKEVRGFNQ